MDRTLEQMIGRIVQRYAALAGARPVLGAEATYALFDGLFEKALLGHLSGDLEAPARLAERARWLLPRVVAR